MEERSPKLLLVSTVHLAIEVFLIPLARRLKATGWVVDAMARGITGSASCIEVFDHVFEAPWSRDPTDFRRARRAISVVRRTVAVGGYDIVHVHTPIAGFVTRFALRHLSRPVPSVVYTAHGFHFHPEGRPSANVAFGALEKLAGRWTDHLVVINKEDLDAAYRFRFVPNERVHYIPGVGVDTRTWRREAFAEGARRFRDQLGLGEESKIISMVAEFNAEKRHQDALRALSMLGDPNLHLVLAGLGPREAEIRQLAKQLGLETRVSFLGFCHDVAALICASVATVLPSAREGLARIVLESLSLEVPVIGTNVRGVRELLEGGTGILIDVGDVDALARAIRWLISNPEEARQIGRRGRERAVRYDTERILHLHETLYGEVLRKRPGRAAGLA